MLVHAPSIRAMVGSGRLLSVIRMVPEMSGFIDCSCDAVEAVTCVEAHKLAGNAVAVITELAAGRIRDAAQTLKPYDRSSTHHLQASRRISC